MSSSTTFLWHDYETFGANPRFDRPCQFAYLRTDQNLEPIESPQILYCQPTLDVLPHPKACAITGITPQLALARGEPEPRFAQQIFDVMSRPGTCAVGYNSFRFDDEITRHLFWRNFLSPYQREFSNGNSRFDLINVMRLMRALRPDGLHWADYDDGRPSFRLEDLAQANGLDTECAHDALVDVENTLGLAQMVKKQQPKLWDWALSLRDKALVDQLLCQGQPLLHVTSFFAPYPGSLSAVLPLGPHPKMRTQWLAWDLRVDPEAYLAQEPTELIETLSNPSSDHGHSPRSPLITIKINAAPMLAPTTVADSGTRQRLALETEAIEDHAKRLGQHPDWISQVLGAHADSKRDGREITDPEEDLYGGFIPRSDQPLVNRVPQMTGSDLTDLGEPFSDPRLNALLFRYRARYWPESLNADERTHWLTYCREKWDGGVPHPGLSLTEYANETDAVAREHPEQEELLVALKNWPDSVTF